MLNPASHQSNYHRFDAAKDSIGSDAFSNCFSAPGSAAVLEPRRNANYFNENRPETEQQKCFTQTQHALMAPQHDLSMNNLSHVPELPLEHIYPAKE